MEMMQKLKRNNVIKQLNKLGICYIEGQALEDVTYSELLKTLVRERRKGGDDNGY
ncbi:hypothetical protein [Metasolibacillus meyeri]|uniref:hypothetical protein n=1 Tax=Metasolibacillus meyeri TaxID=1071052 RepID=UPI00187D306A|nr:hypothetical protein [Metasolibacillus meyeri]